MNVFDQILKLLTGQPIVALAIVIMGYSLKGEIAELNTKVAVILERTANHGQMIKDMKLDIKDLQRQRQAHQ